MNVTAWSSFPTLDAAVADWLLFSCPIPTSSAVDADLPLLARPEPPPMEEEPEEKDLPPPANTIRDMLLGKMAAGTNYMAATPGVKRGGGGVGGDGSNTSKGSENGLATYSAPPQNFRHR